MARNILVNRESREDPHHETPLHKRPEGAPLPASVVYFLLEEDRQRTAREQWYMDTAVYL